MTTSTSQSKARGSKLPEYFIILFLLILSGYLVIQNKTLQNKVQSALKNSQILTQNDELKSSQLTQTTSDSQRLLLPPAHTTINSTPKTKNQTLENSSNSPTNSLNKQDKTVESSSEIQASNKNFYVESKLKSMQRHLKLTPEQLQQLTEKFAEEADLFESNLSPAEITQAQANIPSLEEIIGEEKAQDYKDSVNEVFEKLRDLHYEKEQLYLEKKLKLTEEQAQKVKDVFIDADIALTNEVSKNKPKNKTTQEAMKNIKKQDEFKNQFIQEKLKGILSDDQFNGFLELQALSPEQELENWHATE